MSTVVLSELFGDPRLPSRFWAKVSVNPANDCWDWTASRDRKGYGSFGVASGRMFGAHRVAALYADRRENELTTAHLDVKVFGGSHGLRQALGQRELVFVSDFGEHGISERKESLL